MVISTYVEMILIVYSISNIIILVISTYVEMILETRQKKSLIKCDLHVCGDDPSPHVICCFCNL